MPLTNLHTLSKEEFDTLLNKTISALEGNYPTPYCDGNAQHLPSIGIGFNLTDKGVRDDVFLEMGIVGKTRDDIIAVINDPAIRNLGTKAERNAALQSALNAAYGQPFVMTAEQINNVFSIQMTKRIASVKSSSGLGYSLELLTLVSLQFNGNYGNAIKSALTRISDSAEARAEVWFDIRYRNNPKNEPGVARRRYVESELFGLYGAGVTAANLSEADALGVMRAYTRYHTLIPTYESKHGIWEEQFGTVRSADGQTGMQIATGILRDIHVNGITGSPEVGTFYQELDWARSLILKQYLTDDTRITHKPTIDGEVLVGEAPYSEFGNTGFIGTDKNDLMIGDKARQSNYIKSGKGDDVLVGGDGADTLIGGKGDDILIGGLGDDTYVINSGDGHDTIIDSGANHIVYNGQLYAGTFVKKADGKYRFLKDDGQPLEFHSPGVLTLDAETSITFQNQTSGDAFADGDFGFELIDLPETSTTTRTLVGDLEALDTNPAQAGTQYLHDELGNVVTNGQAALDRADTLYGSNDNDLIQSGGGDDGINARAGDDRIELGAGQDIAYAGDGSDTMIGGADSDILIGETGDDTEYASSEVTLSVAFAQSETQAATQQAGDWLDGGDGRDTLVGDAANNFITGGSDSDLMIGGAGDDTMLGDQQLSQAQRDWSLTRQIELDPANGTRRYTYRLDGGTTVLASAGANDAMYGGAGKDWLIGQTGDDFIDGGSDDDVIFGDAGSDTIQGGSGADVIYGDSVDTPLAEQGDDFIDGGEGNDEIYADAGNDTLIGGKGDDILAGGAGKDTYFINAGDGIDTIIDADTGADASVLIFGAGVDQSHIKLGLGSLLLDMGDGNAVHIANFNPDDPLSNPSVERFDFADGTSLGWNELLAKGFDLDGTDNADVIVGTTLTDRIAGGQGNDVLVGLAGDDVYRLNLGDGQTRSSTAKG